MQIIEQSTSITIRIGPFMDETDGKTAETALTIVQADIRLSKNGGDFAQSNDSGGATHDEFGWYYLTLDATDTGTLGRLIVAIHDSGNALPVWREFMVVPSNVWDSLVGGTDALQVHANEITAGLITAAAIATGAIDADAIADNAIDAGAIATDAITSAEIAASGANKIADHTLRRTVQNALDSSDGDAKTFRSLVGAVSKLVNKIVSSGGTLTVYEDDDVTALGTQAVTTDSGANPITELDTT